jgi:hypothetical protein
MRQKMRVVNHELFTKAIQLLASGEYQILEEYKGSKTNILVKHNVCGEEFPTRPNRLLYWLKEKGTFCPHCNQSSGERTIERLLTEKGFPFKRQTTWENLKDKNHLRIDFTVYNPNDPSIPICNIEHDGIQHTKPIKYFGGAKGFRLRKKHDHLKNLYFSEIELPLIRVPYFLSHEDVSYQLSCLLEDIVSDDIDWNGFYVLSISN